MPRYEIDIKKNYIFPSDLRTISFDQSILIIAPDYANWIVLESPVQLEIFEQFKNGRTIEDVLTLYEASNVTYVVTQIEARNLCDMMAHTSTNKERSMHLYLTNKCNLSCPQCYMYAGKSEEEEMTTEEIIHLLSDFRLIAQGEFVTFSGGEPSSRIDFNVIVRKAADLGLKVKLITNGTLLSSEQIRELAPYIYAVQVSIDGFSEESNSKIRGKGNFQKALSTVDVLLSMDIETDIAVSPPIEILRNHIDEYVSFAKQLYMKYSGKKFQIKFAEELLHGRDVNPSKQYNQSYFELVNQIQTMVYGADYPVMNFVRALYNNRILENCMFGNFSVGANGDVFYCARSGDIPAFANIRRNSFADILENAIHAQEISKISHLAPCKNCELVVS